MIVKTFLTSECKNIKEYEVVRIACVSEDMPEEEKLELRNGEARPLLAVYLRGGDVLFMPPEFIIEIREEKS